ncbi:hypothetical protein N9Z02_00825 [Akkermansiaceae bacterium]|nr:hypothetical protein [Akkermansiaceae bacterium]
MPRKPQFKITQTPSGWMVNVPASVATSGKRERHFHKTRDEAKAHSAKLRQDFAEHGSGAAIIKPSLAEDAIRAIELLKPWGLSLVEAASEVAASRAQEEASEIIEVAGDAWQESMEGLRDRSIRSYKVTLNRLIKALPNRALSTITSDELSDAIGAKNNKPATRALHRRNARAFWYFCAKKSWVEKALFAGVEAPRPENHKSIVILSPEEAKALLESAEKHYPLAVPRYALALFAGIRAEEIQKLQPHHVSPEGIELSEEIAKTGRRRHITPNETLKEWLTAYPFKECPKWQEVDCAVRRIAGWDVSARILKVQPKPTRGRWPQNALRHSNATYSINAGVPIETLLFEFGHVGGVEVLKRHYLGRATKNQAKAFFELRPLPIKPD